ncbi:MAG: glycosyltransferase family 4 protein [Ruminococcaceae bacterium]|nr:glycosyltransferase family 4 protein [Oscillospiraceae bacterium]
MKILFYINIMSGGGAERVIANLANYMNDHGHSVTVVNTFPTDKEYPLISGVDHLYLENEKSTESRLIRNINLIKKLRRIIKAKNPDVAVSFMREPNWRLILSTFGLKVKKLVSQRVTPEHEDGRFPKSFILRYPLKKADGIVFQTDHARDYFDDSIKNHSRIILNPVKNGIYDISFSGERKNIVTAGRLSSIKNQLLLIDAFSKIANATDDNLLIYGEGDLRDMLQNRIEELNMKDRVFLMGNSSTLHDDIKSAKIFVLSSNLEGLPNALMEAMAIGLPCISTDCLGGGARMVIDDGKNGFIVPVKDVDAMAEKLSYVLSLSAEERDLIGTNARKSAESFKADVICKNWEDYMIELTK